MTWHRCSRGQRRTGQKIAIADKAASARPILAISQRLRLSANALRCVAPGTTSRGPGDEAIRFRPRVVGGVAKNATIIFVYAGLITPTRSCAGTALSTFGCLNYAVQTRSHFCQHTTVTASRAGQSLSIRFRGGYNKRIAKARPS